MTENSRRTPQRISVGVFYNPLVEPRTLVTLTPFNIASKNLGWDYSEGNGETVVEIFNRVLHSHIVIKIPTMFFNQDNFMDALALATQQLKQQFETLTPFAQSHLNEEHSNEDMEERLKDFYYVGFTLKEFFKPVSQVANHPIPSNNHD